MSYNVLIVDDSETVRAIIAKTMEIAEVPIKEVFQAENGKVALDILKADWIDLVLTEINMPVMGGVEMINIMKEDNMLSSVPVVVVSTEGSKTRMDELLDLGVRSYIRKPFTPEKLKDIIESVLGEQDE